MASKTIPIIDFCNPKLKPGSAEWESTKSQVFKALEEYGFFEAIYDKVPNEIPQEIFGAAKETLPLESKMREFTEKPFERYPEVPRSKYSTTSRIVADMFLPECIQTFANTFWPHDGNPHFCKLVKSYTDTLAEFDAMVKMMTFESLGLTDYFDKFMDENIYLLRLVKYSKEAPEGEDESNPRVGHHTDTGFLTTLKQDRPGLQILMPNGEWVQPNVSPLSYVVLVADSFMAWTNGRLKSAFHRVKIDDTDRHSVMLFSSPKPGYIIEAPKELVDEKHPILYKPFDIIDYYDKAYETYSVYKTKEVLDYFAV